MQRYVGPVALLLVVVLFGCLGARAPFSQPWASPDMREKQLRYQLELSAAGVDVLSPARLDVALPHHLRANQRTVQVRVSGAPQEVAKDAYGPRLSLSLPRLSPYEHAVVSIGARVQLLPSRRERLGRELRARYLAEAPGLDLGNPQLRLAARGLARASADETARASSRFVFNLIADKAYRRQNAGSLEAFLTRRGDCTEHMTLMLSLLRLNGIPARGVAGVVVPGEAATIHPRDWHNWVEYHDGRRWRVADPYRGTQGQDQDYVAFQYLPFDGQDREVATRFRSQVAGLKVDWN